MMPVIRISDSTYQRLQSHAKPFVDTPDSVIDRLLDMFEQADGNAMTRPLQLMPQVQGEKARDSPALPRQLRGDASSAEYWFVNVGEGPHRNWDDCVKYGFLAAGWGRCYTDPLLRLHVGSKVFAYLKGHGYVGYGEVTREARPVSEYTPDGYDTPLLDLPLAAEEMSHTTDDHDNCEWVVGVKWFTTVSREDAKTFSGVFANPQIVCRLRHQRTLDFLRREFKTHSEGGA